MYTRLKQLLLKHAYKRVIVIGTTCCGKSTFVKNIPESEDMDKIVFPLLNKEETDYVCQIPWTEDIGKTMIRLVKERVKSKIGTPLFGTVIIDCDLIIYLDISKAILEKWSNKRTVRLEDALNMKKSIENNIKESGIECINFVID